MRQDYFDWLCDLVEINGTDSYYILAKEMFNIPFRPGAGNDINRVMDGQDLRQEFVMDTNYPDYSAIDIYCSLFEMIIALAKRMDFELCRTDDDYDRTSECFWEMMRNLGLNEYSDDRFEYQEAFTSVRDILNRLNDRSYKRNGEGGLFPLRNATRDQRKVELWYQMQSYIGENYHS